MKRTIKRALPAIALVALVFGQSAGAHSPSVNASCSTVHDEAALTVPGAGGKSLHVKLGGTGVWEETNNWAGLQTHAHRCTVKSTKKIRWIKADARLI